MPVETGAFKKIINKNGKIFEKSKHEWLNFLKYDFISDSINSNNFVADKKN